MPDDALEIARRALGRPEHERAAFIDGACGQNAELFRRVQTVISDLAHLSSSPPVDPTKPWAAPPEAPAAASRGGPPTPASGADVGEGPGSTIGPYKILERIGEGGFGYVFMAAQSHPVKRRVALKVIKPGMDTKQVISRFESERQALALMDHPNIARVLDAGTTQAGRPYFVMELVRGMPITEFCDSQRLSTQERCELFISVCHAVQHAHLKGVIHRDLKPSNVMVTLHDATPVVKVIDFGIAKAINQDLGDETVFTRYRHFMGTPEYMAPEQASMSGLDVDTRADIYSLGVLLYQLVAGAAPFDTDKLRSANIVEIQKILSDVEPPRPSARVHRATRGRSGSGSTATTTPTKSEASGPSTQTAEEIARLRRTDPRGLKKLLVGDLDCIVMKAMEKDRRRRYDTATAMADDIQRYLRHEPILARPASAIYRFRKMARRNRLAFGAGGVLLYALLLAMAAMGYGWLEARHERDKTAERETVTRAQMLLSSMNAVRKYTTNNVRPALQRLGQEEAGAQPAGYTRFDREMVPGFSARQVFSNFREHATYNDFVYKEAAPNPTNKDNKADAFESELVRQFDADRSATELTGIRESAGTRNFYIARPMIIADQRCLDCHTTPEAAPPKQLELYGREGGFGWKLNEVVAAQIVYVPVSEAFQTDRTAGVQVLGGMAGVSLVGILGSAWLLFRQR